LPAGHAPYAWKAKLLTSQSQDRISGKL
jgi:hypothetical protein